MQTPLRIAAVVVTTLTVTVPLAVLGGTPVSDKYRVVNHYPFTGELDKVIVKLTD
jgi:hypothetical protein